MLESGIIRTSNLINIPAMIGSSGYVTSTGGADMNIVTEKPCNACGEVKPVSEFHKYFKTKEWRKGICKSCDSLRARQWQLANPEKHLDSKRKWKSENRDKENAWSAAWHKLNPQSNKLATQKYRENNRETLRVRLSKFYQDNPEKAVAKANKHRALKYGNGGKVTPQEWRELLERTGNKCLCCGASDVKLTQDHVIPLCRGGMNVIDNIQPLCQVCNSTKGTKVIDYRV